MVAIDTQAQINLEAMIKGNEPYWELKKPYYGSSVLHQNVMGGLGRGSGIKETHTAGYAGSLGLRAGYRVDSKCGNSIDQIHNGCKKGFAKEGQHCLHEL